MPNSTPTTTATTNAITIGFTSSTAGIAKSAREAGAAAAAIGFPVALKAVGPRILHKSDVGGVRLSLKSQTAVRRAYGSRFLDAPDEQAVLADPLREVLAAGSRKS